MSGNNHTTVEENDTRTVSVTFRNQTGTLTNPTTISWAQRTPTQLENTGTVVTTGWTTPSTGVYTRTVAFTTPGLWQCEARGAGNGVDDIQTFNFEVRRSTVRV
jgi:hypothetical protein